MAKKSASKPAKPRGAKAAGLGKMLKPAKKTAKKLVGKKLAGKKIAGKKVTGKKVAALPSRLREAGAREAGAREAGAREAGAREGRAREAGPPLAIGSSPAVLDRLYAVIVARRDAAPALSHSARLLSRGTAKIAQKFGEEAVECLIEAVGRRPGRRAGRRECRRAVPPPGHVGERRRIAARTRCGVELHRREGVSGVAEKASRSRKVATAFGTSTTKIP